jgi:EAL domain-containing protein (putative c-di-GMP-specific phosphodiesterase class I)
LQPLLSGGQNLDISEEIRSALRFGRFCLAFQPVVSSSTREVYFHECLARIRREDGSLLAAGSFIPAAEQMGLMREIDDHICRLAVYELRKDPGLRLAINLSGLNVGEGSWIQHLRKQLSETPNIANRLIIEITETAALSDIHEAARFVQALRDLGCMVALDDFGAGYTSYRQLRMLPVNLVKIDGSFANGVATNVGNQLFVRTLVELANGFGLETIAECVETAEDAEMLAKFGVGFLQGIYFARPETRSHLRTIDSGRKPAGSITAS